ncbi:MAG: SPFH domain-containing protein [Candidatus Marsarchaeota archaeon]|nr:SPFH domain-containing protein [Candidatus Marsarchaeota archaeon]
MTTESNTKNRNDAQEDASAKLAQDNWIVQPSRLKIMFGWQHVIPANVAVVVSDGHGVHEYSARKKEYFLITKKTKDAETGVEVERPVLVEDPESHEKHTVYGERDRVPNAVYPKIGKFQKTITVPLSNFRVSAVNIKLNDKDFAEFLCDVVAFVHVVDPIMAAERTTITGSREPYEGRNAPGANSNGLRIEIDDDFRVMVESIIRTAAMQHTIMDLFKNRDQLQHAVEKEVRDLFPKWGLQLVNVEVPVIKDADGSVIIDNLQRQRAAVVDADTKKIVAQQEKEARVVVATQKKEAEIAEAENSELAGKRDFQKDKELGVAKQQMEQAVQDATKETNEKKVGAERALQTGTADYSRTVTITNADAQKEKRIKEAEADNRTKILVAEANKQQTILEAQASKEKAELEGAGTKARLTAEGEGAGARARAEGEGEAAKIAAMGKADGEAIQAKLVGQANGTREQAKAQKEYMDATGGGHAALDAKKIDAWQVVNLKRAEAMAQVAGRANINLITDNPQKLTSGGLLGEILVGPEQGIALAQELQVAGLSPETQDKLISILTNPANAGKTVGELVKSFLRTGQTETSTEKNLPKSTVTS